jgi:hypothetical protein
VSSSYTFRRLVEEYARVVEAAKAFGTSPAKIRKAEAKLRSAERRLARAVEKEAADRARPRPVKARQPIPMARAPLARTATGRPAKQKKVPTGLKRGKPLQQGQKPLKQTKPMPTVNRARAAKMREERFSIKDGYRDWICSQPCIRCGRWRPEGGDPMHVKGVDLGGKAEHLLPGCRECHTWQETHKRQFEAEMEQRHGMTALEMAKALRVAYTLDKEPG